jgi:hypothetical protein
MNGDDERGTRRDVKERYGFASWSRGTDARAAPIRRFLPPLEANTLAGLQVTEITPRPESGYAYAITLAAANGAAAVAVIIVEYDSIAEAQEALVGILEKSMAGRLPDCSGHGLTLGDVCFCGFEDPVNTVVFTRDNVLVRVTNRGVQAASVADVASEIDRQLIAQRSA